MAFLLALIASVGFGTADYFGGLASRQNGAILVALFSHIVGVILFGFTALLVAETPSSEALFFGAIAGIVYGLGFIVYYQGFAVSQMGLISVMTAVWTAVLPVVFGLATGEQPSLTASIGIIAALISIILVSSEHINDLQLHRSRMTRKWASVKPVTFFLHSSSSFKL